MTGPQHRHDVFFLCDLATASFAQQHLLYVWLGPSAPRRLYCAKIGLPFAAAYPCNCESPGVSATFHS